MNITKKLFLTIYLSLLLIPVLAQSNDCDKKLKNSELLYESGNYAQAANTLNNFLKDCSPSAREKEQALILLTQTQLEQENYKEAQKLLVRLLNQEPNFKLKEGIYQEEFNDFFRKTNIFPSLMLGLSTGINIPHYRIKSVYQINDSVSYSEKYKAVNGYTLGTYFEYQFIKGFSGKLEGTFNKFGYQRNLKSSSIDAYNLLYSEEIKTIESAIYLKKYFFDKPLKPFVFAGFYLANTTSSSANVELNYQKLDNLTQEMDIFELNRNRIDVLNMRNKYRKGLDLGCGINYKSQNWIISGNTGAKLDINSLLNKASNRYANDNLFYTFNYIDNDIVLSRINIAVSVAYIFKYHIKIK